MFAIVAVPFESFQSLPPFEFKLMAAVLRYVNRQGECCPSLHQLAADVLVSEATVSRAMTRLEQRGCFTRERQGNGRYLYRIAERFLARRRIERRLTAQELAASEEVEPLGPAVHAGPGRGHKTGDDVTRLGRGNSAEYLVAKLKRDAPEFAERLAADHLAAVQDGLSQRARQEVTPSSDQRSSEGEQAALSEGEIPSGWEEAAAAERRLAGLGAVNLPCEWRKLLAYSEGARITIWRWRGWALKARGERSSSHADELDPRPANLSNADDKLPGDDRQQRQARDWVRRGFWLRDGSWGPAPDQAGCTLPAELLAWCIRQRAAAA